jgi:hypothetical protein
VQRNFSQWRNLAITIAYPYPMVIAYRLYFSQSRHPTAASRFPVPHLSLHPPSRCIMHVPQQINGGCGGPFGPDSYTSIIQAGAAGGGGAQDAPEAQEVSRLGAQVTRSNWHKLSSLKRGSDNGRASGIAHTWLIPGSAGNGSERKTITG